LQQSASERERVLGRRRYYYFYYYYLLLFANQTTINPVMSRLELERDARSPRQPTWAPKSQASRPPVALSRPLIHYQGLAGDAAAAAAP